MTQTTEAPAEKRTRRNPAPIILLVAVVLLAVYYVVIGLSGALKTTTAVPVSGSNSQSGNYMTLRMSVQDVDLSNRVMQANVLPIPHGTFEGEKAGEISKPLRIEVSSGGVTTSVVTFPGQSVVDATSLTLTLDRGDTSYPFDQPFTNFQLSVQNDDSGDAVPFEVDMSNSARPWVMQAERSAGEQQDARTLVPMQIDGHRDTLSVVIVSFYILAILFTTLMAVVTIGSAILRRKLEFANVIWLSATLLSFPALRSAMPGAPPIGTTLDFVFLFPCLALVAIMFVWTGAYLLWRESKVLRGRTLEDDAV
ncbi:DUF4436 family protein [Curtobacterium sp. MCBA15_008]|uniref:DUF4436 family protein n=1 Tax=Curtobacterium sp. MCBA15_008 TaxID=1898736 RepID=UPI0008DE6D74|nr:DUF4436 family protein [Curtobacterium sp. MCBA15_008]OII09104.1 hypothetical protein BIU96_04190 [Curtobacterium sp. MCBA15_008]